VKGYVEGDAERRQRILSRIPLARLGQPEEIGGALVFLASGPRATSPEHDRHRWRLDGLVGPVCILARRTPLFAERVL